MHSLVCETIQERTMADLRAARDRVTAADLVELRLDGVADLDVAGALADRRQPVIVTCRAAWEGGRFDGSEDDRLRVLQQAIDAGAEYVDVEWRAEHQRLDRGTGATQIVLSHHDFTGVPADLPDRVRAMRAVGAEVVKVSVMANALGDCLRLRDAMAGPAGRQVAIAMGAAGAVTRVWPAGFGSAWTYGGNAAPGQLTVARSEPRCSVRARPPAMTAVYAVTGHPLGHSASPAMHNAAFQALGLDAVYVSLPTPDIEEFDRVARALGVAGASVTAPLKEWAYRLAHEADALSKVTQASNTLRRSPDGWTARTSTPTDSSRRSSVARCRSSTARGGARRRRRRAARRSMRLVCEGARVEVSARNRTRPKLVAATLGASRAAWPPAPGWDLLVNATPVGTWPAIDEAPIPQAHVQGGCVYDLVYNPRTTRLLSGPAEAGARDDRRARDAGGAGRAPVRVVDRPSGARRDVMAEAAAAFVDRHRTGQ